MLEKRVLQYYLAGMSKMGFPDIPVFKQDSRFWNSRLYRYSSGIQDFGILDYSGNLTNFKNSHFAVLPWLPVLSHENFAEISQIPKTPLAVLPWFPFSSRGISTEIPLTKKTEM